MLSSFFARVQLLSFMIGLAQALAAAEPTATTVALGSGAKGGGVMAHPLNGSRDGRSAGAAYRPVLRR